MRPGENDSLPMVGRLNTERLLCLLIFYVRKVYAKVRTKVGSFRQFLKDTLDALLAEI